MKESTSREKVLKNIRNALISKTETDYSQTDNEMSVYREVEESSAISFAQEFTKVSGKFVFCEKKQELLESIKELINNNGWENVYCGDSALYEFLKQGNVRVKANKDEILQIEAGITGCEFLVSRLGSIVVSSKQVPGRIMTVYPPVHIVIASMTQIVKDLKDAIEQMKNKYGDSMPSLISIITGPSRTADIEKTLVMGAHGPKELYCFLTDDELFKG